MLELERHLPCECSSGLSSAGHALYSRVSALPHLYLINLALILGLRGGSRGSGSSWLYDGGAFVQQSILTGKPVILVTIKCVSPDYMRHI